MDILARIRFGGRNRRRNGESGQSLAETSLVFPMLIAIMVGAVNLAQVAYRSIEVANSAKAGTQYGCQNGFTAAADAVDSPSFASQGVDSEGLAEGGAIRSRFRHASGRQAPIKREILAWG